MDLRLSQNIIQSFDFKTMEVLNSYIEERTRVIHTLFARETSIERIRQYQGMLEELKVLGKIRDTATAITELNRNGG